VCSWLTSQARADITVYYGPSTLCVEVCGNGIKTSRETCDDDNSADSDGCSALCSVECGYTCSETQPNVCRTTCGDSQLAGLEKCDDGNTNNGDGCSADCNSVEAGWSCLPLVCGKSRCTQVCGDGIKTTSEACDDGNTASTDGCSAACFLENGYTCAGQPSVCSASAASIATPEKESFGDKVKSEATAAIIGGAIAGVVSFAGLLATYFRKWISSKCGCSGESDQNQEPLAEQKATAEASIGTSTSPNTRASTENPV
jgi:cysteine-rich repeat protein